MEPLNDDEQRWAFIHRQVTERSMAETGWPQAKHEAYGLSPSEERVFRAVLEGREVNEEDQGWLRQVYAWGLIEPDPETGQPRPSELGRQAAPYLATMHP